MEDRVDIFARHQHYVERYKSGEVNKLAPFLRAINKDLNDRLGSQLTFRSRDKIARLLSDIYDTSLAQMNAFITQYEDDLLKFGATQADFAAGAYLKNIPDFNSPSASAIKNLALTRPFANSTLKESLSSFAKEQARMIRNVAAMGFAEGLDNQQIIKNITGTSALGYKDGIVNTVANNASRLIKTTTQHMSSMSQLATYNANSDLVKEYMWVSTLDGRTSMICKSRDGKVYKVNKGPLPPAHPNCRSVIVAVFRGETYIDSDGTKRGVITGIRPDNDSNGLGSSAAKTNYNQWLKRQPKSFQVETLGESRTALFRQGGLTIDNFTDAVDQPLTLEELRKKFPKEWDKSGLPPKV